MSAGTRSRRAGLAGATVALLGAAVLIGANALDGSGAEASDNPAATTTATATVERRDLAEYEELSGTLGFGDDRDVASTAQGVITALPDVGTTVERGQTMVEVDGVAVPLFYGDRPLWRTLDSSSSDGEDIRQIEENLTALGFATADTLTVDDDWTSATTAAVKRWQDSRGVAETGVIAPGDLIVLPDAVRISAHPTAIGQPAAGPVATVTGVARQVTIDLDARKQTLVAVDQLVEVVLPDGTTVDGTITEVGSVAETDDGGDPLNPSTPTVAVRVALAGTTQAESFDHAPVTVRVTTSAATDVLAAPVDALLALAEGGYAVERRTAGGTELVAVDVGAFADGWVEIAGDLSEGDEVVVPS